MSDEIATWIKEQVLAADFIEWFNKKYKINTEYHGIKMSWERVHPSNEVMLQEYKKEKRETMKSVKLNIHIHSVLAVPDCKITVKKKRKSWIEKIRDYDFLQRQYNRVVESHNNLQARCNSAEAMRDHYKILLQEWQHTAIFRQHKLENLGRRLKFSVGHNHIEIIVGNPVTACYFHNEVDNPDFNEDFLAVSILHKNDTYDWKRGAVESLDNMIHNWIGSAYGDPTEYFNTLFTTYPELGIQPVVKPVKKTKKVKK
jgi:hypothetical protein